MQKMLPIALIAFLALTIAGCTQSTTTTVDVYVMDESGQPVNGAYINAYTSYSFTNAAGDKWTRINGQIEATATTNESGYAQLNITPGQYAITANKDNATGGAEKLIILGTNTVNIAVKKPVTPTQEAKLTIDIVDEQGKSFDVEKVYADQEFCPDDGTACKYVIWEVGHHSELIIGAFGKYRIGFLSLTYQPDANISTIIKAGDDLKFTIKMKKIAEPAKPSVTVAGVTIGQLPSGLDAAAQKWGGAQFRGQDDLQHTIPFALELADTELGGSTFTFDGKTIWYQVEYPAGSPTADAINVTFRRDHPTGTILGNAKPRETIKLGGQGDRKVEYYVYPNRTMNRLWLFLNTGYFGAEEGGKIQNGNTVKFAGTSVSTGGSGSVYVPKSRDIGGNNPPYNDPNAKFTADFTITENSTGKSTLVVVNTENGTIDSVTENPKKPQATIQSPSSLLPTAKQAASALPNTSPSPSPRRDANTGTGDLNKSSPSPSPSNSPNPAA
ncbi:Uncharacterised protein [uncultured archaeon]|nr:Uncharacterised protein [uncultured archaeon]